MLDFLVRRIWRLLAVSFLAVSLYPPAANAAALPDPAIDTPHVSSGGEQSIVLAGGCFWGIQSVFEHLKGVTHATAGYTGGTAKDAQYEIVSTGTTGHAESVEVTYNPSVISYGQILKVYFSVAHDPTQLNRQGPDEGTQYRSEIFYTTPEQQRISQAYIAQLQAAKIFSSPIVTQLAPLEKFYPAEDYHQDYMANHPYNPYILINDAPKLAAFKREFPDLFQN